MPRGIYTPNDKLISVLKSQGRNTFRVTTIRDLFSQSNSDGRSGNELRRWVNGQFRTLLKHGYIRIASSSGVRKEYKNTASILGTQQQASIAGHSSEGEAMSQEVLGVLKTRLRECKLEMITCSGETKEYEELSRLFPEMRDALQRKFNSAKEKNIEYMGRMKALELLIAESS